MAASRAERWLPVALLVGVVYLLIGRYFPQPADNLRAWRLAAWVASGVAYAAHLVYEHFTLRNVPWVTALHAATAVAIGAAGLAVAAMIHSLATEGTLRTVWLLALIAWPAFTAVPAFLVALTASTVLARLGRSENARSFQRGR